jgi:hypothetical protein
MKNLPFRHIHLDFHTSPLIPEIGKDFDPQEFVTTLQKAYINSITVFAKCHHGMSYYPTKVGVKHPHLDRDLLGEMVAAGKRAGLRMTVYTSVVWDEYMATHHPEWRQVDEDGKLVGRSPLTAEFSDWQWLCLNTPYIDYVAAHTEEILTNYEIDGIFFDIIMQSPCLCRFCQEGMRKEGLNPENLEDRKRYSLQVSVKCMQRLSQVVWTYNPELSVFFNSRLRFDTYGQNSSRNEQAYYSHWELESLASGQWGYSHFPIAVRYFQALEPKKELAGQTGRFHKSWADFGALKNRAALEYECFRIVASGAKCIVGDQLHPRGKLNQAIYHRIGAVYEQIARKEAWCRQVTPQIEIGVINAGAPDHLRIGNINEGVMRMLLETHYQFELLDALSSFDNYPLVILPDTIRLTPPLKHKLDAYLAQGGKLLLSYQSGLMKDTSQFGLDLGITYEGEYPYTPSYIHCTERLQHRIEPMDHVMYDHSSQVVLQEGTEALASIVAPYFNRTWEHFSSHTHTPADQITSYPAITRKGPVIYIASAIFGAYIEHGYRIYRELVQNCLELLLPEKLVTGDLPTTAEVTLMQQQKRLILHILHYIPQRTSRRIDLVEEVIPLYNRRVSVKVTHKPTTVYLAPEQQAIPFTHSDKYVHFTVPEIRGHQMVIIEL